MSTDPDGLRYYQREAFDAVMDELSKVRSTLIVKATGLGKTQTFGAIAKHWPGGVLVLAHRKELIHQARDRIEQMTGEFVDVEMASRQAYSSRIIVGSVQSVAQERRMRRLSNLGVSLIIVDEAHHAAANSYRKILDYFDAKVLGVTATPDRGDALALGQVFDSVAYEMDILDGIYAGYLCPVEAQRVTLDEIDISWVKTSAGDLAIGQLDEAMVKAAKSVAAETLRIVPSDQGIAFFPGIKSAMLATETMDHLRPGSARFVCGETPQEERDAIMRDFRAGRFQFLCNVGVATEGFDHPGARVAIIARPTKSRALYTQMCGRVTRVVAPGLEQLEGEERSEERRSLIAGSSKPNCLVLDFCGAAGRHSLCSPVDVLGGKFNDEEIAAAKEKEAAGGDAPSSVVSLLIQARANLRALAKLQMQARARIERVNPFLGDDETEMDGRARESRGGATPKQIAYLHKLGYKDTLRLSRREASSLIEQLAPARKATDKQRYALSRFIPIPPDLSFDKACAAMSYVSAMRAEGKGVNPEHLRSLLGTGRQV